MVPKIVGKQSADMAMVLAPSERALTDLPLDKWNIPIPDEGWGEQQLADIDVVLVPCVAVDRRCNRLGHGKGYYDCFIERSTIARRAKGLGPPVTIALALREQVVDEDKIPLGPYDQQLDFIVSPDFVARKPTES